MQGNDEEVEERKLCGMGIDPQNSCPIIENCTVKFEFEEDPYHDISSPYLEKVSLRYMARKTDEKIDDMTR